MYFLFYRRGLIEIVDRLFPQDSQNRNELTYLFLRMQEHKQIHLADMDLLNRYQSIYFKEERMLPGLILY